MEQAELPNSELIQLASDQCNDQLDADGAARLEALLSADPAARREYLRYMFLHAHMATSDVALQAAFEKEELAALRAEARKDEVLLQIAEVSLAAHARGGQRSRYVVRRTLQVSFAALLLIAPVLLLLSFLSAPAHFQGVSRPGSVAKVTNTTSAKWEGIDSLVPGQPLYPGTLRLNQGQASLKLGDGADVALAGPTTFGVESESTASLFSGKLRARLDTKDQSKPQFVLQARGVRVVDLGTEFGVEVVPNGITEVHCFEGEIETLARVRAPQFYWTFDEENGPVVDNIEGQTALMGPGVSRVAGLIGQGALKFDNTQKAFVNVGNGDGPRLGTGRFGVSRGITIEVLTIVGWSGDGISNAKPRDYDEIFRKEDGVNRMLLCFQNDNGANIRTIPSVPAMSQTLSFGLYLAADGYSELEVALDGRDGRPSLDDLRDGQPHHIVATYDSWTGVKALYIDGRLCQKAKFPDGTLIIGGGPTDAIIGNMAGGGEPYSGTLDELAIYDFALTPEEVAEHWQCVERGTNYFGGNSPGDLRQNLWKHVTQLKAGEAMRFDSETGVSLGKVPFDEPRFRAELASAKH